MTSKVAYAGLPVPHEPPKLLLIRELALRGLLLERAERSELALGGNHLFHAGRADGADQLVLEIRDAHVEAELLHVGASEVGPEAAALEAAPEIGFLSGVTETREPDVETAWAELFHVPPDRLSTADGQDGNPLRFEVAAPPLGKRLQGQLVADPLDEHDRSLCAVHGPAR